MARTGRKKSKSGLYHIVLRGINKQTIFYDDEDREVFLNRLKTVKEKEKYELYAFCFMSNHIHLLMREVEKPIGEVMRNILTSYVYWYNSKYERVGNLFQDRYKSEPIEDDIYLLSAVRYIHRNPVKAKLVKSPSEYKWNSYSAYLSEKESIITKELILSVLQGTEQYIKFMEEEDGTKLFEPTESYRITDEKLIKAIKKKLKIEEVEDIYKLNKEERSKSIKKILEIEGSNPNQVSRVTGVPIGIIRGILD